MSQNNEQQILEKAELLLGQGKLREALDALAPLLESGSPALRIPALDMAAHARQGLGEKEEATVLFQCVLDEMRGIFGPRHPYVAGALQNVARMEQETGHPEKALPLGREALDILEQANGPDDPDVATARLNLSSLYYNLKRWDEAEAELREALRVWEKKDGRRSAHVATCLNNMGRLYEEKGEAWQGVVWHLEAVDIRRELFGVHPDTAFSLGNLGAAQIAASDPTNARISLEEALEFYTKLGLESSGEATAARRNLELAKSMMAGVQPFSADMKIK